MYVGDYLARRCLYSPNKLALVDATQSPPRRLTYAELNERANRLANALQARGIRKGDRVGMLAYDGLHVYDLFFACGKLGAIFVPFNWRLHARELERLIGKTEPALLFYETEPPMQDVAEELRDKTSSDWVPLSADDGDSLRRWLDSATEAPVSCYTVTELDTACLLFTGGTTGEPKAAQISHRQIVWNAFNTHLADVQTTDVFLNIFPMFHTGGLFAFTLPLLILGGTIVQLRRFEPDWVLELIEQERVTLLAGVPTMFQALTESPRWPEADLGSLRYCLSGGAPMPVPLIRKYAKEKGVVFRQGFGMTEFGPSVFSLSAEDAERKAGSIGMPNFFVDARVVDVDTGRPLPPGEIGELVLRGPTATTGYYNDPEATARLFDVEGFLHTGDLAYVDDEGYFFIVDRLKDMFISGGENVYPAEIEAVLYQHPAVARCAVVSVPDERWGQVGVAFVVRRTGNR
ncbi:MAG: AMP-binding protein [candidate division KSB1 bacterium]|nr:AMP-binding protein [candidate division KSB1 bacterium]